LLPKLIGTLLIALLLSKGPTCAKVPHVRAKRHNSLKIVLSRQQDYFASFVTEVRVQLQVSACGGQSGTGTGSSQAFQCPLSVSLRQFSTVTLSSPAPHNLCNKQTLQCHRSPVQSDVPFLATACAVMQTSPECSRGQFCSALATLVHSRDVSFSKNPHGNK